MIKVTIICISRTIYRRHIIFAFLMSLTFLTSCKKLVDVREPIDSMTTQEAFATDDQATASVVGLYSNMINSNSGITFCDGAITIYAGMSADELLNLQDFDTYGLQFQNNILQAINDDIKLFIWGPAYSNIYTANASLEALSNSTGVHDSVKNELIGEVKFIRAFSNFYLINLFGDIPLITTTNWNKTSLLPRTSVSQVYQQIIDDLQQAQKLLPGDYSVGGGERIRPNKWAATALLSRVYLYNNDWQNAGTQSSSVINNTDTYNLTADLNGVFSANSTETIWQLQLNNTNPPYNATLEGDTFIPFDSTTNPRYCITQSLLNAFEPGDMRKTTWIDSTNYAGTTYYVPFKYNIGPALESPGATPSQYYMMLRLAEQYLIRAEARINLNDLTGAQSDLNTIRNRAGLSNTSANDKNSLLSAIINERRVEFFAEWGHRWLDLKRVNLANNILHTIKPNWTTSAQLYPIPQSEIEVDPNLVQNPSY